MSVLNSKMSSQMKGEICGQFYIQQNQVKYSPYWWWRAFTFAAHHQYRIKTHFFKFIEHVTKKIVNQKYFWYDILLIHIVMIILVQEL